MFQYCHGKAVRKDGCLPSFLLGTKWVQFPKLGTFWRRFVSFSKHKNNKKSAYLSAFCILSAISYFFKNYCVALPDELSRRFKMRYLLTFLNVLVFRWRRTGDIQNFNELIFGFLQYMSVCVHRHIYRRMS